MQVKGAPILIILLALTAFLRGQVSAPPASPAAPAGPAPQEPGTAVPQAPATPAPPAAAGVVKAEWKEPLRLYREFFGIPADPEPSKSVTLDLQWTGAEGERKEHLTLSSPPESPTPAGPSILKLIADRVGQAHYDLTFAIALIPDPLDSDLAESSDQALAALQSGYADRGYLLDRLWLPWKDEAARDHAYRQTPGLLLFRRIEKKKDKNEEERRLAGVFLVGETPKQGLHKAAFATALELIAALRSPRDTRSMTILGPSFSGSAESLRLALLQWRTDTKSTLGVQIVSGTATAAGLAQSLNPQELGATFCRTVVPDNILLTEGLRFLDDLGWKGQPRAFLTESDTGYGHAESKNGEDLLIQVPFPSGLSSFRAAAETDGKAQTTAQQVAGVKVPKTALDLSLAQSGHPVDLAPEWSELTPRAKQLAISNLLAAISRDGIRRVGVLATDVRDRIFLAKLAHELFPDVILFSLSNDLLYAHPQYGAELDGMLVLSSFPLLTEGPRWRKMLGGPEHRFRRQFGSEFEEGIFRAVQYSLDPESFDPHPAVWIAAVGNGSLWPLAQLQVPPAQLASYCRRFPAATAASAASDSSPEPPSEDHPATLADRVDLPLVSFLLLLVLLAQGLRLASPPLDLRHEGDTREGAAPALLALGWATLWLLGATFLVVGALPVGSELWQQRLTAMALGALYTALLWGAARFRGPFSWTAFRDLPWVEIAVALPLGEGLILLLNEALRQLWMPEPGAPFFHLRARRFSSGLSPLVSLTLWSAALCIWVYLELKRRRLIARQAIPWPLADYCEPPLSHCDEMAKPVDRLVLRTLPPLPSRFWWFFLLAVAPPAIFLYDTIQPIAETRLYGQVFLTLVLGSVALAAVSFYQFIRLWLTLHRLLDRLSHTRLLAAFERISGEVDWKPMRSFGWQVPTFQTVVLSAAKLAPFVPGSRKELEQQLKEVFEAEQNGSLVREVLARRQIHRLFADALAVLGPARPTPEIDDLFAARIVAYLRPVLGHMRNALLASLCAGLLTLAAVRTYAFEPQQLLSFGLWGALLVAVAVTLWIFVEMDRNPTLSRIGGTEPGKVTFDRHFLLNVSTYGLVPILGILVSQFPQVGRLFVDWFNPLLRVTGVG